MTHNRTRRDVTVVCFSPICFQDDGYKGCRGVEVQSGVIVFMAMVNSEKAMKGVLQIRGILQH